MNFNTIIQRLNELTTFKNNVTSNSKKIFELPEQTDGEKLVAVWNEASQRTEQYNFTELIAYINSINTRIVNFGTIDRDENEFTFNVGFEWIIQGIEYANTSAVVETIELAESGNNRIDIAVLNTSNNIVIVTGFETDGTAEQPLPPPNTILLKIFVVTDADITEVDPPAPTLTIIQEGGITVPNVGSITFDGATIEDLGDGNIKVTITGGGGSTQNLQEVLEEGNEAEETSIILITPSISQTEISGSSISVQGEDLNNQVLIDIQSVNVNGSTGSVISYSDKISRQFASGKRTDLTFEPVTELEVGTLVFPNVGTETETIATRQWTENLLEGLKTKQPVRVATTANITLSGTQTIDGVALSVDDRVLVKDQTTQTNNGIYLVKSGAWERASDANTATELTNAVVSVLEGTANGQSTFRQTTTSITLGSSNIVWAAFGTSVPDATPTTKGKAKLFNALGNNTDGALNQAVVTNELLKLTPFQNLVNRQLSYFLPRNNSALFAETLRVNTLTINGNASSTDRDSNIIFSTSAVAGNIIRQRGGVFIIVHENNWYYDICLRFRPNSNITDSRFFIGISNSFILTDPTNVEPTTILNTIGLGKLSTSDNLHIIHNDNTGLATTIDLGVNYPMTDVTEYYYDLRIEKLYGTTDAIVTVTRYDSAGNQISTQNTLTSDLPSGIANLSPFAFITNNATASVASFRHYGCVLKQGKF